MERAAWAEAVFHVLAHVDPGPAASRSASCHDPDYVAWSRAALGPAEDRALAEDVRLLQSLARETLARVQLLAWLWDEPAAARDRDLAELQASEVAEPRVLAALVALGPTAEVLRAAAELELPLLARAPYPPAVARPDLTAAAPMLARCTVAHVRSLPRRGRVHNARIFIGAPGVAGAEAEHLAWQAAHEATVFELAAREPNFRAVELRALGLLRARAARAGLGERHARWLATVDHAALGPIPDVTDLGE